MNLRPETSPFPRVLVGPLLALSALAWVWLHWRPDLVARVAHCPLKDATGIPCPTCGGTHAAIALARGDLATAWWANPLVVLIAAGLALWSLWALAASFVPRWRRGVELGPGEKKAARILAALLIVLAWVWQFFR